MCVVCGVARPDSPQLRSSGSVGQQPQQQQPQPQYQVPALASAPSGSTKWEHFTVLLGRSKALHHFGLGAGDITQFCRLRASSEGTLTTPSNALISHSLILLHSNCACRVAMNGVQLQCGRRQFEICTRTRSTRSCWWSTEVSPTPTRSTKVRTQARLCPPFSLYRTNNHSSKPPVPRVQSLCGAAALRPRHILATFKSSCSWSRTSWDGPCSPVPPPYSFLCNCRLRMRGWPHFFVRHPPPHTGDVFITRHSNLEAAHIAFHLVGDNDPVNSTRKQPS